MNSLDQELGDEDAAQLVEKNCGWMSLKHPSILKRNYLIGKSYAKKEIAAATFITAKTFTLFIDTLKVKED